MSRNYVTVFIVESAHSPTRTEQERICNSIIDAGMEQGFEPIRVSTDKGVFSEDANQIKKWERS